MPHPSANTIDSDIVAFSNSVPPPPYPGADAIAANLDSRQYDLTPTPQILNRPRLPEDKRNPHLRTLPEDVTIVKFQTIVRENREIVVGRIKVPTPGPTAHAFILRRYDTDAVSLTTMYKVAFPHATEDDEKREMDWVKSSYDTRNTNGGRGTEAVKLAGQWVTRHLAIHLAPAYGITDLVAALTRAVPDPHVAYRKSQRSQAAADEMARGQTDVGSDAAPSMSAETASPAPKRQRMQSPRIGTPAGSAAVTNDGDRRHLTIEATTTITAPTGAQLNMDAEIASAKQLVKDLTRQIRLRDAAGDDLEDQGIDVAESSRGVKRGKGEAHGVGISGGAKDRVLKTNKRVEQGVVGETAKRIAWGAAIFTLGVGAATLLPFANFF